MKKLPILAMLALSLTGCGSIPGLGMFGSQDSTTTASTAQQSFYSIMGVEGEDLTTETASGSAGQPGRANLGQLLFDLLDTNADGEIVADEFSAAVRARRPAATDAEISKLFTQLDQNQDSAVTLDELQPKARGQRGEGRGGRGDRMAPPPRHHHFGPPPGGAGPRDEGDQDVPDSEESDEPQA